MMDIHKRDDFVIGQRVLCLACMSVDQNAFDLAAKALFQAFANSGDIFSMSLMLPGRLANGAGSDPGASMASST